MAEIRPDRVPCGCACLLALLLSAAAYLDEGWEQDKRGAEARHANFEKALCQQRAIRVSPNSCKGTAQSRTPCQRLKATQEGEGTSA